jgi:uncharacterized protein DUF3800
VILLYVDESGQLGSHTHHFALGGVAVHEADLERLRRAIAGVVRRRLDEHLRGLELHAQRIRTGSGPWGSIARQPKEALLREIPRLLGRFGSETSHPYGLFAVAQAPGAVPQADPMERCFEELFLRFTAMLVRDSQETVGIVVADEAKYEKLLQPVANSWRAVGTRGGRLQRLSRLAEVPLFADSKAARLLQMADFVAHFVYRYYNAGDKTMLSMLNAFDRDGGVIHGLVHLVPHRFFCPCPPCMSRATAAKRKLSRGNA